MFHPLNIIFLYKNYLDLQFMEEHLNVIINFIINQIIRIFKK